MVPTVRRLLRALVGLACLLSLAACAGPRPAVESQASPVPDLPAARAATAELLQRLVAADEQMAVIAAAEDLAEAQAAARFVVDALVGPRGRGAEADTTLDPGVLPGDVEDLADSPGLALRALDLSGGDERVRQAVEDVLLGDLAAWRRSPRQRWDEMDERRLEWSWTSNPMPRLDGHLPRVVSWARLTLDAPDLDHAHEFARHGRVHTTLARRAVQTTLEALSR